MKMVFLRVISVKSQGNLNVDSVKLETFLLSQTTAIIIKLQDSFCWAISLIKDIYVYSLTIRCFQDETLKNIRRANVLSGK